MITFLLSKNAVWYANWQLNHPRNNRWPDTLFYYGIGQSTAEEFQQLTGHSSIRYPEFGETSEDLPALSSLQQIENKRVLLL